MTINEQLIADLPDADAARRFIDQLAEKHWSEAERLGNNEALLSDVLTLVSFSPLIATTLLQNPDYLWWLNRKRRESGVRGSDDLLESFARFSLAHSQLEPQVLFARFRRRELLRIYLRDIRRLATIAEITEEISNLADAILQAALETARREIDNRHGTPQETDEQGRLIASRFCIAALGKLGSRELNYSSDIDLLFLYSNEGMTTGYGSRGPVTNREYFAKLAEYITKLVGQQIGEGSAYRVDLRLRPHGTLGALALSVTDTARYCRNEARAWERQVLIRSRGCAGDIELFKEFFGEVEDLIFSTDETPETALANVRRSKEKIDLENLKRPGFNVKLGRGGIREIEFLAQALQLAHGGRDKWLRSPHTLISLSRLADRKHLTESDLAELSAAYEFLRRTEHVLQMKNGLQTHTIPDDPKKRDLIARNMTFATGGDFEADLLTHSANVSRIFSRVFGEAAPEPASPVENAKPSDARQRLLSHILASIAKSNVNLDLSAKTLAALNRIVSVSPNFAAMVAANPQLVAELPDPDSDFIEPDYATEMLRAVEVQRDFGPRLAAMRRTWSRLLLQIVVRDIFEKLSIRDSRRLQTNLAEASIAAAIRVVRDELADKYGSDIEHLDIAILALGKLGGRGLDYDSDLDLLVVYFDPQQAMADVTPAEFYIRAVEIFSTALSSMTRDGNLYRVDLRLRPFGSKGLTATSIDSFLEYMAETAEIWEMLAFVKLRFVGGDPSLGYTIENETRRFIHQRALSIEPAELRDETRRVRLALEQQRAGTRRGNEVDIKYGSGGMLDVYFAMRYLQLRDNIPDDQENRSTLFMLNRLKEKNSLTAQLLADLSCGYEFLSTLDHNLRLTVGRSTRIPFANADALATITARMRLSSTEELLERLTFHRLAIRGAFNKILP